MQKCNFDLAYARGKYDRLVKTHLPMLSMYDFKEECGFPLDKECSVFFAREVDCKKKTDFLIIDRKVLDFIGFRNGNFQIDLCKALDRLRKIAGFIEGRSLNDSNAHFVVLSSSVWIRVRHLEYFMIMANTENSFMIREYFLDLKRIMYEYHMYQSVYRSKFELCVKDSTIGELRSDMRTLIEKSDIQSRQNQELLEISKMQSQKMDMLCQIMRNESNDKVLPVKEKAKAQELVVLQKRSDPNYCEVLRGQVNHLNNQLKRKQEEMEIVGKISTYKNPINLFNRFGDYLKENGEERFKKTNNKIILNNGSTASDLVNTIRALEEEKHTVAHNVKQCL